MSDIKEIVSAIKKFRDQRDWMQFHNHKDMAISICLEAAEVLEHFQWKDSQEVKEYARKYRDKIGEELADVAIYLLELTDNLGLDFEDIIYKKLKKNSRKYPIKKAKGSHQKYNQL